MEVGKINTLKVIRKTDLGYMLGKDNETVFLHNNETNNKVLEIEQEVEAFLYFDFKSRIAASLLLPKLTIGKRQWVKVIDKNHRLGVFVDIGIQKDLLVSKDDLPMNYKLWPNKGDKLYIEMILKTRLLGKQVLIQDIRENVNYNLKPKDKIEAFVIKINENGINVLSENNHLIFIHHTQIRKQYRLGEKVEVTITHVYDQAIHGTLIYQKEKMIDIDSETILNYLKENIELPLTNHSSPEEIKEYFLMSKKAFKRAIGALYKNNLIQFKETSIIYIGDKNE